MDFDLSEEQSILKASLDRLLADQYGFDARRKHMGNPDGWSRHLWRAYADMGLMALPFAEPDGGIGGGSVETMIVMECFGRALVLEPYFPTVVLGGAAVRLGGSAAQKAELIPAIAAGDLRLALAHTERNSGYDLHRVTTKAVRTGSGWKLSGAKCIVLHGDSADKLVVSARTAGADDDPGGIGLFLVDALAQGVSRRGYATQDGQRAAEITFDRVDIGPNAMFGDPENGFPLLCRVVEQGIAALSAEAVGVLFRMHQLTLDYLRTRKQFGVAIGTFQALQHKAVDMHIALEQVRAITLFATMMADSDDDVARAGAMHAAKVEIGRSGRLLGENAIQLHGGIGMAMEYAVGHYFRRATMIEIAFGDTRHHLEALASKPSLFAA